MISLLKSELFRLKKDKFQFIAFVIILFGYVLITLMAGIGNKQIQDTLLVSSWMEHYFSILKLTIFLLCNTWYQEFRNNTIKNICTSGKSIEKFYLSKLIVQFIICIILFIWALTCFILCFLTLKNNNDDISFIIEDRFKGFGIFVLYSFAEISILNSLYLIIKKDAIMFILYFFIIDKIGNILSKITNISFFDTISLHKGYVITISVFSKENEKFVAIVSMIIYIILVNFAVYLILRKNFNYEK